MPEAAVVVHIMAELLDQAGLVVVVQVALAQRQEHQEPLVPEAAVAVGVAPLVLVTTGEPVDLVL